ncbi:MAG: hypothetical protein RLZZ369_1888 [Pseudomonadota bacterium]
MYMAMNKWAKALTASVGGALLALGGVWLGKDHIPVTWTLQVKGWIQGYDIDHDVRIAMPDGTQLAASLYKPLGATGPLPTIYLRLPYGRLVHGEGIRAASYAKFGYAVLVQDVRGKYDSGGDFQTWQHATGDGAATLDWITRQPWSNGKVGTLGCSALGELQYSLARAHHPAHRAMVASGAGGGIGMAMGGYEAFGWFESGVFELAAGFGWFQENGTLRPGMPIATDVKHARELNTLPMASMIQRVQPGRNGFEDFMSIPLGDPRWDAYDYVTEKDTLSTPALVVNTWGDQTLQGALDLAALNARSGVEQHVILGPGNHCEHLSLQDTDHFGELEVKNAKAPYPVVFRQWFDHWLKDEGPGLSQQPPYIFYVLGEHRWLGADAWPPKEAVMQRWYLHSQGRANSAKGDGRLQLAAPAEGASDVYRYDPMNPTPTRGGPICCTGNPADVSGPVNQKDVESREDVLVYTSDPLTANLRIAGPLMARLVVSSDAKDTDFVARLVHVWPDGRATNIQEGVLRARYRKGMTQPELMEAGQQYELDVGMRSIAYLVPKGHRIRLDVTSSNFPRLERNLNTGGRNYDETTGVVATNKVHHGGASLSYLTLPVLDKVTDWQRP